VLASDSVRRRLHAAGFALAYPALACAQTAPAVTEADIEQVRRAAPVITDADIARAQARYGSPSGSPAATVGSETGPNIDALPVPQAPPPIDLEALARGYSSQGEALNPADPPRSGPALLVFVSFSMPEATLQLLADQAEHAGATLVLRGLVGESIPKTVSRVQSFIGSHRVAVQIDPQAFERFAVIRAPTFALLRDGARGEACTAATCYPNTAVLTLSGDISLDYALDTMIRRAPAFAGDAQPFLRRLQARHP